MKIQFSFSFSTPKTQHLQASPRDGNGPVNAPGVFNIYQMLKQKIVWQTLINIPVSAFTP